MTTPGSPAPPTLDDLVTPKVKEQGVPVHKLNNPESLGVSIRVKDFAIVAAATGISLSIPSLPPLYLHDLRL